MAKHEVELRLTQGITIKRVDAVFPVWSDSKRYGKLRVSKGSVDWQPVNDKMVYRLSWEKFADLMEIEGRKVTAKSTRRG
jgi:hypothetical protein